MFFFFILLYLCLAHFSAKTRAKTQKQPWNAQFIIERFTWETKRAVLEAVGNIGFLTSRFLQKDTEVLCECVDIKRMEVRNLNGRSRSAKVLSQARKRPLESWTYFNPIGLLSHNICLKTSAVNLRSPGSRFLIHCLRVLVIGSLTISAKAQTTTVNIPGTVQAVSIDRPGINLGGLTPYGPSQLFKSLGYGAGGSIPATYWGSTFQCASGTPTTWTNNITYNGATPSAAYATNFWVGATFVAMNSATGTSYGSGVVTASTAQTASSGVTFTLSPAISGSCSAAQADVLIVRQTSTNSGFTPNQVTGGICSAATYNTIDTSPMSTNTQQSLQMPSGCSTQFTMDAVLLNASNPYSSLASQSTPWLNLNGSYMAGFKAKCAVAGCSIGWSLARAGGTSYVPYTVETPAYSATHGAGWTTYSVPFTASETGGQTSSLNLSLLCTGTCLIQDADVAESSTLAGNTTVFRDAVVANLQQLKPGSIRYMDGSQWCSDVADQIAATGNRRWCGASEYVNWLEGPPIGYADVLELANFIGSDVWISVGLLNQAADWTKLINWLNSSGWTSTYAAAGHKIYLEDGNEAWNTGVPATLFQGNGSDYGYTLGLKMAAAKAAGGYNSSVIKLVGNSWNAAVQGYSAYGWLARSMQSAGCTLTARAGCPDLVDNAPYTLNTLGSFTANGANVATTGAPFLDEWAEIANLDSVTSPAAYATSVYLNQQYAKSTYGVNTAVYEVNESTTTGVSVSQAQLNQIDASVGNGLAMAEHTLLMQRDSQVTGPIHAFTLAGPYNSYNGAQMNSGLVVPLWGTSQIMATGPGQAAGASTVNRPWGIELAVINNAIGSNTNLLNTAQSNTPTFSYAGGQPQNGSNTILSNTAVPYVNCFAYANSAQSAFTGICFNNNLTQAETVLFTGAGAPTGTVTETLFPNSNNVITDNNEATYVGPGSIAPVVTYPTSTTTGGTSYTIPPASMITLNWGAATTAPSSPPVTLTLAAPVINPGSGTYSNSVAVSMTVPAGAIGCYQLNGVPTATKAGTCDSGSTTYTGPVTLSSSGTVSAIATQASSINSAVTSNSYTVTIPVVPVTPTAPGLILSTTFNEYPPGHALNGSLAAVDASGGTWSDPNGDWAYGNGGVVSSDSDLVYPTLINLNQANYTAVFTYPVAGAQLLFRYVDANDYVMAETYPFGEIVLYSVVAGTRTTLASIWPANPAAALTVTLSGSTGTISCGGQLASATLPTTLLTGTQLGFFTSQPRFAMSSINVTAAGGSSPTPPVVPPPATTTTSLIASSTVPASSSVILTATTSVATGTVTFLDGSSVVGTAMLSAGKAVLSASVLTAGTHSYTAVYGGSSTYATSTSSAVSVAASSVCSIVATPLTQ